MGLLATYLRKGAALGFGGCPDAGQGPVGTNKPLPPKRDTKNNDKETARTLEESRDVAAAPYKSAVPGQ